MKEDPMKRERKKGPRSAWRGKREEVPSFRKKTMVHLSGRRLDKKRLKGARVFKKKKDFPILGGTSRRGPIRNSREMI